MAQYSAVLYASISQSFYLLCHVLVSGCPNVPSPCNTTIVFSEMRLIHVRVGKEQAHHRVESVSLTIMIDGDIDQVVAISLLIFVFAVESVIEGQGIPRVK